MKCPSQSSRKDPGLWACIPAQKTAYPIWISCIPQSFCSARGRGFSGEFRFAAEGEASLLYALTDYLSGYLGIAPECLHILYGSDENGKKNSSEKSEVSEATGALRELLSSLGLEDALDKDITKVKDVVIFGNANTIAHILAYSGNAYGVEISSPGSGYINVIPKTLIGPTGALYILEQVLNARRLLGAWD